ncbi:MAG: alpha-amylase family glycosyl hydrolase [Candidatus Woesearchaeota archaeon]
MNFFIEIMLDLKNLLKELYTNYEEVNTEINKVLTPTKENISFSEKDIMLITYTDSIEGDVDNVRKLAKDTGISTMHFLPFHPYSSDKGFSIKDFEKVRKDARSYEYLKSISEEFKLCYDLVLNHVSKEHKWFKNYLKGKSPGKDFFIERDEDFDEREVFRPRQNQLFTEFETKTGKKQVWTTFSSDQIDLNYKNPKVLIEIVKILNNYLVNGASIIRLDAIAYIWKESGSRCVHLNQTMTLIKIIKKIMNYIKPGSLLLTETNFGSEENLSYMSKHKADMVYQFPLPPLILHSVLNENSNKISEWMEKAYSKEGYYLNFTSSHDGIGLTALYNLGLDLDLEKFIVSFGKAPYEINNSYYSTLENSEYSFERFFLTQTLMLSLKGIPGVYINSLFGEKDNKEEYKKTGLKRDLNRKKYSSKEIEKLKESKIYKEYKKLISIRTNNKNFHPKTKQKIIKTNNKILCFKRGKITVICNFTQEVVETKYKGYDLITQKKYDEISLKPYQVMWIQK